MKKLMLLAGFLIAGHNAVARGYCHIKGTPMAITDPFFMAIHQTKLANKQPGLNPPTPNYVLAQEADFPSDAGMLSVNKAVNQLRCHDLLQISHQRSASDGTYFNTNTPLDKLYTMHGITLLDDNCAGKEGKVCFTGNTQKIGLCLKPVGGERPVCNANTPLQPEELEKYGIQNNGRNLKTDTACAGLYNQAPCVCSNNKKQGICGINRYAMPGMERLTLYCHCD